ncbi:hypothetical protein BE221DRAFT_203238 [Ostreococcus tauri]|uniref:Uncharacterized protein n=1 Tax=Ostreococcus tauri TaxID=70448 RepID=A0A1Y5IPA7_OSTTA|nr:hypothetical protein BE221DRAFT_203238 [Ostreococcus tauri]
MARENKMKVEAWRTRRAEKEARTRETAEKEARRAAAVRRAVFEEGREAREARARARANERAERAEKVARATTSGRSSEAMLTYFRARDAMDVRRRTEEIERARGEEERLARELRLRAATSRKAPVVPRSVERAASATEAWLRRRAATMDDHFRVMEDDLDVFERANRLGWILNAREHRRATPRWRTIEPGVALREY